MDANDAEVQALRMIAGANPICGVGMVKRFNVDARGGWGFITVESSEDVIFHASRGLVPFFSGDDNPGLIPWNSKVHQLPQAGNQILFAAEVSPKGMRAVAWMLWKPTEWRLISEMIEARPMFRLIRRKGPRIQGKFKGEGHGTQTVWQGKNVLTAPKNRLTDTDDEGLHFEQMETGQWVKTDFDPRYRTQEIDLSIEANEVQGAR